jgi:hypothetical protein
MRTVARLTIPILAIVATASTAKSAGPQGDVSVVGGRTGTEQKSAIDPLLYVVPEPLQATPADTASDIAGVAVSGRPRHVAGVRPQGASVHLHEVRLSEEGQLQGRVAILVRPFDAPVAANAVTVYLVQSGAIVARTGLDSDGVFQANVTPGVYSVIAVGSGGFAASSVHVLGPNGIDDDFTHAAVTQGSQDLRKNTSARIIDLVAVPPAHFEVLERLMEQHVRVRPRLVLSTSEPRNAVEQSSDGSHPGATAIHDPMSAHMVRMRQDGCLIGRMRRLHLQTGRPVPVHPLSVFFIRNGVSTEGAPTDENGEFELSGLEPGPYSVVAVGPDGFAAFDILVLPPQGIAGHVAGDHRLRTVSNSSRSQDVPEMLEGSLVALQDVQDVLFQEDADLAQVDGAPIEPFGQPGAMAGSGAGGSAWGGSGLADALMGAGVGAAVGAGIGVAVASDDVASPFSP